MIVEPLYSLSEAEACCCNNTPYIQYIDCVCLCGCVHTNTLAHHRGSDPSRCFWLENTLQHVTRFYQQQRRCNLVSLSFAILLFSPFQSSQPLPRVNTTSSINNRRFICIFFHTILVNRGRSVSHVPRLSRCDKGTAKYWMSLCAVCTCGLFTGFGVSCC